jgi:hypothetical protein
VLKQLRHKAGFLGESCLQQATTATVSRTAAPPRFDSVYIAFCDCDCLLPTVTPPMRAPYRHSGLVAERLSTRKVACSKMLRLDFTFVVTGIDMVTPNDDSGWLHARRQYRFCITSSRRQTGKQTDVSLTSPLRLSYSLHNLDRMHPRCIRGRVRIFAPTPEKMAPEIALSCPSYSVHNPASMLGAYNHHSNSPWPL